MDISIAEKYYTGHDAPMTKTTQRFYREYFGLHYEWCLAQRELNWAADFEFVSFPYLINGVRNHLEEAYPRDMSGYELVEIEQAVGQKYQPTGYISYYYPARVRILEYRRLYAKYECQNEIECFPNVLVLIKRELRQYRFDSAVMKTVRAPDGKPWNGTLLFDVVKYYRILGTFHRWDSGYYRTGPQKSSGVPALFPP